MTAKKKEMKKPAKDTPIKEKLPEVEVSTDAPSTTKPPEIPIFDDVFIKAALLAGKYVSDADIAKAEDYTKSHHAPLTDYLFNEELLNKDLLGHAIAEALHVRYID